MKLYSSFAQATTKTANKQMKLAIEEERTEARAIKATACNLIMHGLEEWIDETPVGRMKGKGRKGKDIIHSHLSIYVQWVLFCIIYSVDGDLLNSVLLI